MITLIYFQIIIITMLTPTAVGVVQVVRRMCVSSVLSQHQVTRGVSQCQVTRGVSQCQVPFRPRRSLMYVPGNDDIKLSKIPALAADCVCLDCEDGVALNKKEAARNNIRKLLDDQSINFGKGWFRSC